MNENEREEFYDETISDSMQDSIARAVDVLKREMHLDNCNRIVIRPKVSIWKGIIPLILYFTFFVLSFVYLKEISSFFGLPVWVIFLCVIIVFCLLAFIMYKKAVIWLIHIYQRFAPERMRASCLFEPSCSNYMIQAIQKYGAFKGTIMGFKRVSRCHIPNGGIDYP